MANLGNLFFELGVDTSKVKDGSNEIEGAIGKIKSAIGTTNKEISSVTVNAEDMAQSVKKGLMDAILEINTQFKNLNKEVDNTSKKVKEGIATPKAEAFSKQKETLEEINAYYRELEQIEWNKAGNKLDFTDTIERLKKSLSELIEEFNVLQEIRQESGGGYVQEYRDIQQQIERTINLVNTLKDVQSKVSEGSGSIGDFVYAQFEKPNIELQKMAQYYRELDAEIVAHRKEYEAMTQAILRQESAYDSLTNIRKRGLKGWLDETKAMFKQKSLLAELMPMLRQYLSIYGGIRMVKDMIAISAEFEKQRISLEAILRDSFAAKDIFTQIKGLAVESPFQFQELVTYVKQLSAYSIPIQDLYNTTKMLADVSAGLGVGMDRLVLAYGQIRSAAFLRGQEVRQLTEAGIPILEELKKQFVAMGEVSITVGDVFDKISQRQVPFEMVEKVFKDMTSEGGKFYKMQEVLADTLSGKLSNLKDAYQIMMDEIGESASGPINSAVDALRKMIDNYKNLGFVLTTVAIQFSAIKASKLFSAILDSKNSLSKVIDSFKVIAHTANNSRAALSMLRLEFDKLKRASAATKLEFATGILGVLLTLIAVIGTVVRKVNQLKNSLKEITNEKLLDASSLSRNFERLKKSLEESVVGSQNYRDAISKINSEYGEYLPNLLSEIDSLDVLEKKMSNVTEAIYARAQAYAYEEGEKEILKKYRKDIDNAENDIAKVFGSNNDSFSFVGLLSKAFELNNDRTLKPSDIFKKVYKDYYGGDIMSDEDYFSLGISTTVSKLYEDIKNSQKELDSFSTKLQYKFGKGFNTRNESKEIKRISEDFDELKKRISAVNMESERYNETINKIEVAKLNAIRDVYTKNNNTKGLESIDRQLGKIQVKYSGIQEIINSIIPKTQNDLLMSNNEDRFSYMDRIRKTFSELPGLIQDAKFQYETFKKNNESDDDIDKAKASLDYLNERISIINAIQKAGGVYIAPDKEEAKKEKDTIKDRVDLLNEEIDKYQELKEIYKELLEVFSESEAKEYMKGIIPLYGEDMSENFDEKINSISEEIRKLGETSEYASEKYNELQREFAKAKTNDDIKNLTNKIEEEKKFIERINGYIEEQKTVEQLISDLENTRQEDLKRASSSEQVKAINDHYDKEIEKQKDRLKELNSITLTDFWRSLYGDTENMNYDELYSIRKYADELTKIVENIKDSKKSIDGSGKLKGYTLNGQEGESDGLLSVLGITKDGNKEIYLTVEQINELVKAYTKFSKLMSGKKSLKALFDQIDSEGGLGSVIKGLKESGSLTLQMRQALNDCIPTVGKLGTLFVDLGKAIGSTTMQSIGEALNATADVLTNLSQGNILGAASSAINYFSSLIQAQAKFMQDIVKAETAYKKSLYELSEDDYDTIFGVNSLEKLSEYYHNASKAAKEYSKSLVTAMSGTGLSDNSSMYNIGKAILKVAKASGEFKNLFGYDADRSSPLDTFGKAFDKLKKGDETFIAWVRANRENITGLLGTQYQTLFDNILDTLDNYEEELEKFKDSVTDIFESLADSIVDNMVDAFKQTGDAAYNIADSFTSISESMVKMILKSYVMEKVLKQFEGTAYDIYEQYANDNNKESLLTNLSELISSIKDATINYADFANEFLTLAQEQGMLSTDGNSSLKEGIKSITEDTANLLASYLNAIRADVSVQRMICEGMSDNISTINSNINLGLVELQQINANTKKNADTADGISRLLANSTNSQGFIRVEIAS